jgi:uncharacterized protein YciI
VPRCPRQAGIDPALPRLATSVLLTLHGIHFLVYSRAAPGAADVDDPALNEEHWAYMDRFAEGMVARGPTLTADRASWTGSLHIVDLPSADAAREFVEREPYNRAGLFCDHFVRRFENLLGRTMWESRGKSADPRFLVIADLRAGVGDHASAVPPVAVTALPRERLIVHGELLAPDDGAPVGVAFALQAPTREAVDTLLAGGQAGLDEHFDVEVLDWEFGGRR